jgi:hypothetical protein
VLLLSCCCLDVVLFLFLILFLYSCLALIY